MAAEPAGEHRVAAALAGQARVLDQRHHALEEPRAVRGVGTLRPSVQDREDHDRHDEHHQGPGHRVIAQYPSGRGRSAVNCAPRRTNL